MGAFAYRDAPRCPFCNGKVMFRPCPCLKLSCEMGVLEFAEAQRMLAEMSILFETREPMPPGADEWPPVHQQWAPILESAITPWHRRLRADCGAMVLPFMDWAANRALVPPAWLAVVYKDGKITENHSFPCEHGLDRSPAAAMFWADMLIRQTAWDRVR